jgi:dihydroneopterin aldolase
MATAPSFFDSAPRDATAALPVRDEYALVTHVRVVDLTVSVRIGINPDERGRRQPLLVSVDLELADAEPIGSLHQSVDYRRIVAAAEDLGSDHIELIETYAHLLGERCLALGPVERAEITVAKPQALSRGTASVRIALTRRRRLNGQ